MNPCLNRLILAGDDGREPRCKIWVLDPSRVRAVSVDVTLPSRGNVDIKSQEREFLIP